MNFAKAQKEIVAELLAGRSPKKCWYDDRHIFVSPDGAKGYIFPVSTVVFNLEKLPEMPVLPIAEVVRAENELKLTPDLRIEEVRRRTLRRLKGNGKNVFVNIKFLDCFQNPKFYQAENKNSLIVVTESIVVGGHGSRSAFDQPVGVIMPVALRSWDDSTYYNDEA